VGACISALAISAGAPGVLAAQEAAPLRLVRCAPARDIPCLTTRLRLPESGIRALAALDSVTERGSWTGVLGGARLIGPGLVTPPQIDPPLRLLVLLDRSGSMIGEGIAFTRLTLRSFIAGLDSATARVAVAGFESRNVARGIAAATFDAPAEAGQDLDRLPAPDRRANTALYSALVEGVRHVAGAVAAAPGSRGAILLVTDGRNDVDRPGDDAGLLAGPDGLRQAADAAARSGSRIWIMGVGDNLSAAEIGTLAGQRGSAATVSLDPNAMAARLASIARELRGVRELTFGVPGGAAAALARAPWFGTAAAWKDGRPVVTHTLVWRPPLYALPAYEGVAEPSSVPPELRDAAGVGASAGSVRWLMALCFGVVGVVLWVVVPRYAWAGDGLLSPAPPRAAPRAEPAAAPAQSGGLHAGISEAPPRKPTDVTQELPAVNGAATPSRRGRGK
jgi:hypothetical protein